MIALGIVSGIAGLGALCWLMFNLAVYALPFFAGITTFLWAYNGGAGPIGAAFAGLAAGVLIFVAGQTVFTLTRTSRIRIGVSLLFTVPAALAGYHVTHGLAALTMSSQAWQVAFSLCGAAMVGLTACLRMALPTDDARTGLNVSNAAPLVRANRDVSVATPMPAR